MSTCTCTGMRAGAHMGVHAGNISVHFGNLGHPRSCNSTREVPFWVLGLKWPTGGHFGLLLPRHPPSPRPRVP
jgi:hypothetical protein